MDQKTFFQENYRIGSNIFNKQIFKLKFSEYFTISSLFYFILFQIILNANLSVIPIIFIFVPAANYILMLFAINRTYDG